MSGIGNPAHLGVFVVVVEAAVQVLGVAQQVAAALDDPSRDARGTELVRDTLGLPHARPGAKLGINRGLCQKPSLASV